MDSHLGNVHSRKGEIMGKTLATIGVAISFAVCPALMANAADLPKSGTAQVHSGWHSTGEIIEVGPDHSFWNVNFWGVSFNEEGKGFLHDVAWYCPVTIDIVGGDMSAKGGLCVYTDQDGDKFFGEWEGAAPAGGEFAGELQFTSGTGKYQGITGSHTFRCGGIGDHGQLQCHQTANYKLP